MTISHLSLHIQLHEGRISNSMRFVDNCEHDGVNAAHSEESFEARTVINLKKKQS